MYLTSFQGERNRVKGLEVGILRLHNYVMTQISSARAALNLKCIRVFVLRG